MKKRLNKTRLDHFTTSNWRLKKLKLSFGLAETHITGEADDTPQINVSSWTDRLP